MGVHGQPPVRRPRSACLGGRPSRWILRISPNGNVGTLAIMVGDGRRRSLTHRQTVVRCTPPIRYATTHNLTGCESGSASIWPIRPRKALEVSNTDVERLERAARFGLTQSTCVCASISCGTGSTKVSVKRHLRSHIKNGGKEAARTVRKRVLKYLPFERTVKLSYQTTVLLQCRFAPPQRWRVGAEHLALVSRLGEQERVALGHHDTAQPHSLQDTACGDACGFPVRIPSVSSLSLHTVAPGRIWLRRQRLRPPQSWFLGANNLAPRSDSPAFTAQAWRSSTTPAASMTAADPQYAAQSSISSLRLSSMSPRR